jgi:hypothetical protein
MADRLLYPASPESPKYLLKLALANGFQSTSQLLTLSVLGSWVVALISYLIQSHLETTWLTDMVAIVSVFALVGFALAGIIKCDALYSDQEPSDWQVFKKLFSKIVWVLLIILFYAVVILAITWISGFLLQLAFKPGSMALGVMRIALGFAYLFFLVSTFLILPMVVLADKPIGTLVSELLHVCIPHWLRCFLCLFCWLVVIDCLAGNLALILVPALAKIAYSMLVVKTVMAVVALPVLISYTTLLMHDVDLRAR